MNESKYTLWRNFNAYTMRGIDDNLWGVIENASMLTRNDDGRIEWLGRTDDLPKTPRRRVSREHNLLGACVTPALIDCHTHLVYAGDRAREFEMRLNGATYEEIARSGGGIRSTVAATRAASDDELYALALDRARRLMHEGIATIEIKSGYGLSEHDEARSLAIARRVGREIAIPVRTTFLGAHALPDECAGRADDYIDAVCDWLPRLHAQGLVDAVDVFCENIGFSAAQTRRVFERAKALGLPVKLHAEQLSDQGGAALASEFGALSCDHLEYVDELGITAMANAGTVAVMLPTAFYFLRETRVPPIQKLRDAGVPMALATDHNPGSSPTLSPTMVMNMACTLFRMTPLEAWHAFTVNAVRALGMPTSDAQLSNGGAATFAIWAMEHPRDACYAVGGPSPLAALVVRNQLRFDAHKMLR
jgi:imidazolonepropionase